MKTEVGKKIISELNKMVILKPFYCVLSTFFLGSFCQTLSEYVWSEILLFACSSITPFCHDWRLALETLAFILFPFCLSTLSFHSFLVSSRFFPFIFDFLISVLSDKNEWKSRNSYHLVGLFVMLSLLISFFLNLFLRKVRNLK